MEKSHNQFRLFPNYFKKIGAGIILSEAIIFISGVLFFKDSKLFEDYRQIIQIISVDFIIASLLLYSLAKDKIEDELKLLLRMQSLAFAFIFGVMYVIIQPLANLFFYGQILDVKSQQVVLSMLLVYLIIFIYKKKRM
jgi:hypothetical protein